MLKRTSLQLMVFAGLMLMLLLAACSEEDINRNVYQYNVRYEVVNYMDTTSDMIITYSDPDIANRVSEYLEDVKVWKYEFKGKTLDRCFIEAVVVEDSANLAVKVYVDSLLMKKDSISCLSPIVCDTNRAVLSYTLE